MSKLLISSALAGLLAFCGSALAQDDHHGDRGDRHQQGAPAPQAAPAAAPAQAPNAAPQVGGRFGHGYNPGAAAQNAPAAQPAAPARNAQTQNVPAAGSWIEAHPGNNGQAPSNAMRGPAPNTAMRGQDNRQSTQNNDRRGDNGRGDNGRGNDGRGFDNRGQAFNNDRRGSDSRRDFSSFHRNFNAPQRYRASSYRRPSGWYSHRWTYGEILPSLFWASDFWLNDYSDFDLAPPPPGTVWVRDGEDAILIDRYSGEIIQVEYSVFY